MEHKEINVLDFLGFFFALLLKTLYSKKPVEIRHHRVSPYYQNLPIFYNSCCRKWL